MFKIIECPRDAMQGIKEFIPTDVKIAYHNALLKVGFDTLDFGSFVSPKAIPQLADTAEVLSGLERTDTRLLSIIANERGAREAVKYEAIDDLGFPFSVSQTFQLRNTNATLDEALDRVKNIQDLAMTHDKKLVVYLSMGFGNPYGDPWNAEIVMKWVDKLAEVEIGIMALSDTIGVASPQSIAYLFEHLIPQYPNIEFGAHFHTVPDAWREKIDAAYHSGCRRIDGAMKGFGGCPMARDELTGNMPTEKILSYLKEKNVMGNIDLNAFEKAAQMALQVFG